MIGDNWYFQNFHCRDFMFTCVIMFNIIAVFTAFVVTMITNIFIGECLYFQNFHYLLLYGNKKNRLKIPRQQNKNLASQKFLFFFVRETLIFNYAHKRSIFQKYFRKSKNGHL